MKTLSNYHMYLAPALLGSALILLSGCASTPDPAKVCTAEWIAPRAERAVERIEKRSVKALRAVRSVGKSWVDGRTPGPLQMLRLSGALSSLEDELKSGKGIRDLRTLSRTCDDPELVRAQMRKMLEGQNLPKPMIDFIEATPIFDTAVHGKTNGT